MTMEGMSESSVLHQVQYLRSQHLYIWYERDNKMFHWGWVFLIQSVIIHKKYYKCEKTTFSADSMFSNFLLRLQWALI